MQLCTQAGFQPQVIREATPAEVKLRLVESGMGIALVAANSETRHNANVFYRSLVDPVPMLKIVVAWHKKHQSPALSQFINNF